MLKLRGMTAARLLLAPQQQDAPPEEDAQAAADALVAALESEFARRQVENFVRAYAEKFRQRYSDHRPLCVNVFGAD